MFEDCLVESRVGEMSTSRRWTAVASIGLQVALAGIVIALPLLHLEALRFSADVPKVLLPVLTKPRVPVVQTSTSATSVTGPSVVSARSRVLPSLPMRDASADEAPLLAPFGSGMGGIDVPDVVKSGGGEGAPSVTVIPAKAPAKPVLVSTGVLQGMLIAPIRPVYPAIAKAAHVEGSVVVDAVISRTGTIESLRVVSGPPMLQGAAVDAIRAARYQPYRLNGEATEVQIAITVNFRMGE